MLKKDLITQTKQTKDLGNQITVSFKFNEDCNVFKGYFPGHPIVPSVLEAQLIEEILFETLSIKGRLISASNIKFTSSIYPDIINKTYTCEIKYHYTSDSIISCNAKIVSTNKTYMTKSCEYEIEPL